MKRTFKHGWIPDLPDHRDFTFAVVAPKKVKLPAKVDLSKGFADPFDQGDLGSCTANAISSLLTYARRVMNLPNDIYSRLFIYYNERAIEHTIKSDSGAMIRDGIKSISKLGAPAETEWVYDISKFTKKPTPTVFKNALKEGTIKKYIRVPQNIDAIKQALAGNQPIVFGFSVYESFESQKVADTGVVPMPKQSEQMLGGHAVVLVGYNESKKVFIVRNSWGSGWGKKGYFTMPYAYVTNTDLASDFWIINA